MLNEICAINAELLRRRESLDSDVPSQALRAQLVALLLPFWLEGLGDRSCRGEGGDLKTSVIKL
jgi:hypothetical protein